jgi:hypothetical protein
MFDDWRMTCYVCNISPPSDSVSLGGAVACFVGLLAFLVVCTGSCRSTAPPPLKLYSFLGGPPGLSWWLVRGWSLVRTWSFCGWLTVGLFGAAWVFECGLFPRALVGGFEWIGGDIRRSHTLVLSTRSLWVIVCFSPYPFLQEIALQLTPSPGCW